MSSKPLTCKDIKELFSGKRLRCCYDCHEYNDIWETYSVTGKLDNGWSYKVCCQMDFDVQTIIYKRKIIFTEDNRLSYKKGT